MTNIIHKCDYIFYIYVCLASIILNYAYYLFGNDLPYIQDRTKRNTYKIENLELQRFIFHLILWHKKLFKFIEFNYCYIIL